MAVGSSIQIALFAIPFNVVVGWVSGHHDFSLDFSQYMSPFAVLVLLVCVVHAVRLGTAGIRAALSAVSYRDTYGNSGGGGTLRDADAALQAGRG